MKVLLVSGMSGAGKSQVMRILKDLDYNCVDNLPMELIEAFAALCAQRDIPYAAVSVNAHEGMDFAPLFASMQALQRDGWQVDLIYLDAETTSIIHRYKSTRRRHPLMADGTQLETAIARERTLLNLVRLHADYVVDTTRLNLAQLKETVIRLADDSKQGLLRVGVVSFGFQHGIPADADLTFDVRFLPNPFYVPELRTKTGEESAVRDYVFSDGRAQEYLGYLYAMIDYLIPQYRREGKAVLTIAVGCSGGRHRSVAIAEALTQHLRDMDVLTDLTHRDWKRI